MIKKRALSQRELETEKILIAALPEYTIRANMRLVDVIKAGNRFISMSGYHLDFTICDDQANPIAAVELDDSTHDTEDGQRKDNNKNRWMAEADIKLIRIRKPEEARQIRELMQNYTPPVTAVAPPRPPQQTPPANAPSQAKKAAIRSAKKIAAQILFLVIAGTMVNAMLKKQVNENATQATKTLNTLKAQQIASQALATPTTAPIQIGQPAPGANMVFVKGKSLKECAPNNYINETALRCTKDHYEPRQYGNH